MRKGEVIKTIFLSLILVIFLYGSIITIGSFTKGFEKVRTNGDKDLEIWNVIIFGAGLWFITDVIILVGGELGNLIIFHGGRMNKGEKKKVFSKV